MARASRRRVPLNNRCSRECEAPANELASSRDPTPTQTPTVTERTVGTASVTTRSPPGRTVWRTSPPPPSPRCSVRVVWRPNGCLDLVRRSGGVGRRRRCGRGRVVACLDRHQRELAPRVDLGNLHLDLVADLDDVLDVVDPLATGQRAQLRDVQQTVLAREQGDEGTEGRRL